MTQLGADELVTTLVISFERSLLSGMDLLTWTYLVSRILCGALKKKEYRWKNLENAQENGSLNIMTR